MGITNYFRDTKGELKHVTWPTRRTTTVYTVLIVVISLIVAAYLGALDWLFTNILEAIV